MRPAMMRCYPKWQFAAAFQTHHTIHDRPAKYISCACRYVLTSLTRTLLPGPYESQP